MANRKLLAARLRKCWTQEELAELVGVSVTTMSRWEKGFSRPRPYAVRKLCQVFDMTPKELDLAIELEEETEQVCKSGIQLQRKHQPSVLLPETTSGPPLTSVPATEYTSRTIESLLPTFSSGTPGEQSSSTWFLLKQQVIQTVVGQWNGRAMYCDELQGIIDQELRMLDFIKSLYQQETYTVSRRKMLATLACLPLTLYSFSPQKILQAY